MMGGSISSEISARVLAKVQWQPTPRQLPPLIERIARFSGNWSSVATAIGGKAKALAKRNGRPLDSKKQFPALIRTGSGRPATASQPALEINA